MGGREKGKRQVKGTLFDDHMCHYTSLQFGTCFSTTVAHFRSCANVAHRAHSQTHESDAYTHTQVLTPLITTGPPRSKNSTPLNPVTWRVQIKSASELHCSPEHRVFGLRERLALALEEVRALCLTVELDQLLSNWAVDTS